MTKDVIDIGAGVRLATATPEKGYVKYAWMLVFIPAFFAFVDPLLRGEPDQNAIKAAAGMTLDQIRAQNPGMAWFIEIASFEVGSSSVAFGALIMALAAFPFRKGVRFAWYATWFMPALWLSDLAYLAYHPNPSFESLYQAGLILVVIGVLVGVLGQLLPYRKFFPKKDPAAPPRHRLTSGPRIHTRHERLEQGRDVTQTHSTHAGLKYVALSSNPETKGRGGRTR